MATITSSLGFNIFSRYDGGGVRAARNDVDGLGNSINLAGTKIPAFSGGLATLLTKVMALGPALIPIGATLLTLGAGFAAVGVAAGAAAGIFGMALKGAIAEVNSATEKAVAGLDKQKIALSALTPGTDAYEKQLKKVNAATKGLEIVLNGLRPAQEQFARAQIGMKDEWSNFIKATEKDTLGPVSIVMQAVTRNMSKLIPVVKAVAPLFLNAAKAVAAWLDGPGFDRFIALVLTSGVPALQKFLDMGKRLAGTLGEGFRTFLPVGEQIVEMLGRGADKVADWAASGGFTDFLAYVKEVAPDVKELFVNLAKILSALAGSMAETSDSSLTIMGILTDLLSKLSPGVVTAITYAWIGWNLALQAYVIWQTAASVALAIWNTLMSPYLLLMVGASLTVLAVVAAIAALAAGIFFLVKYWDTIWGAIKTAWFAVWDAIKASALFIWGFLQKYWPVVWAVVKAVALEVWGFLQKYWAIVWDNITKAAKVAWDALQSAWETFSGWMKTAWDAVWGGLLTAYHGVVDPIIESWNTIWPEAKAAAQSVWDNLTLAFWAVVNGFKAAWDWFWGLFGPSFKKTWDETSKTFTDFTGAISSAWKATWGFIVDQAKIVWDSITAIFNAWLTTITGAAAVAWAILTAAWDVLWAYFVSAAQVAWAILTGAWGVLWALIKGVWDTFAGVFMALVTGFWNVLKTYVFGVWDVISTAWTALWKVITAIFLVFFALFTGHWGKAWDAIKAAGSAIWDAIQAGWHLFLDTLMAVVGMFSGALSALWGGVWETIKSVGLAAWALLQGTFNAFINGFLTIWTTAWNGVKSVWDTVWSAVTTSAVALYNTVIKPIADAFMWLWNFLIGNSIIPDIVNGIIYWFNLIMAPVKVTLDFILNLFTTVWNLIWTGAQAIWALFLAGIEAFLTGVQTTWSTIWNSIVAVAKALWAGLQATAQAIWTAMSAAVTLFLNGLKATWEAIWNGIKAFALALWNSIKASWDAWVAIFKATYTAFLNVVKTTWEAIWNGIKAFALALWNGLKASWDTWVGIFKAAFSAFLNGIKTTWETIWNAIKAFALAAWNNLVTNATNFWNSIKGLFTAGGTWLRTTFWNPVANFFTKTIPSAFDSAVKAIGTAWDKLRGIVRAPIQAVVDVVYNNGIVKMWNLVANAFKAPKLSNFTLPAFEKGGPTGDGSAQGFPAILHPGEHVWTAAEVAGAGGHEAVARMRSRAMGGERARTYGRKRFDDGGGFLGTGIGGDVGPDLVPDGIVKNVLGTLKGLALGAISGPFGKALDMMITSGQATIRAIVPGSGSTLEKVGTGIPEEMGKVVKAWVKQHDVSPTIAGGTVADGLAWAKTQAGLPYQWGGNGNPSWDCSGLVSAVESVIRGERPHRRWATGSFSGETAPPGWKLHETAPYMIGITNAGVGHTAGTINGVNIESAGGVGVRVGKSARGYKDGLFPSWYGFTPSKTAGGPKPAGPLPAFGRGTHSAYPGWAVVGDQGPELMRMRGGERIESNADSKQLLLGNGGGGGDIYVTVPVTIQGNATPGTVDKLQRELPDKLRMAIAQGTGKRK